MSKRIFRAILAVSMVVLLASLVIILGVFRRYFEVDGMDIWSVVRTFGQPICFVILIALVLSAVLAARLTKRILEPINNINVDYPLEYIYEEEYQEVVPLLKRIHAQKKQLQRDQEEIEKAALIRQEFTANVSHELKTPLHAISGYAELLENEMVKEEDLKSFAGKIREESNRMAKLVEDILELSKLDGGGGDLQWETCGLYRIAAHAVDSLEMEAQAARVKVRVHGEDANVLGIPQLLYSIIYNLCDNAIKYNHKGGRVLIEVYQSLRESGIRVTDTGIGIPEDSLDRIFERFYRVDKSRSKEVGGTGLGLSIVKHAVLIHGGRMEVKSEIGRGTEFTVFLPNHGVSKA